MLNNFLFLPDLSRCAPSKICHSKIHTAFLKSLGNLENVGGAFEIFLVSNDFCL